MDRQVLMAQTVRKAFKVYRAYKVLPVTMAQTARRAFRACRVFRARLATQARKVFKEYREPLGQPVPTVLTQ